MIPRHLQIAVILLLVGVLFAGGYMLELRRREQSKTKALPTAVTGRPLPAPDAGPAERVKLVVAYDEDGVLIPREANVHLPADIGNRVKEILRALLAVYADNPSPHPVPADGDIKTVFVVNGDTCVVDLNAAFAAGHRSGILVEQFTIASMVETITANYPQIRKVKFLVEGQERETLAGHADLMVTYEYPKVHDFVLSLQNVELELNK